MSGLRLARFELAKLASSRPGAILCLGYWLACAAMFLEATLSTGTAESGFTWPEAWPVIVLRPAPLGMIVVLALVATWQGRDLSLGVCRQTLSVGFPRRSVVAAKIFGCFGGLLALTAGQIGFGVVIFAAGGVEAGSPVTVGSGFALAARLQLQFWCFGGIALVIAFAVGNATAALLSTFGYVFLIEPTIQLVMLRIGLMDFVEVLPTRLLDSLVPSETSPLASTASGVEALPESSAVVGALLLLMLLTAGAVFLLSRRDL